MKFTILKSLFTFYLFFIISVSCLKSKMYPQNYNQPTQTDNQQNTINSPQNQMNTQQPYGDGTQQNPGQNQMNTQQPNGAGTQQNPGQNQLNTQQPKGDGTQQVPAGGDTSQSANNSNGTFQLYANQGKGIRSILTVLDWPNICSTGKQQSPINIDEGVNTQESSNFYF